MSGYLKIIVVALMLLNIFVCVFSNTTMVYVQVPDIAVSFPVHLITNSSSFAIDSTFEFVGIACTRL